MCSCVCSRSRECLAKSNGKTDDDDDDDDGGGGDDHDDWRLSRAVLAFEICVFIRHEIHGGILNLMQTNV